MTASLPRAVGLQCARGRVDEGAASRGRSATGRPRAAVAAGDLVAAGACRWRAVASTLIPGAARGLGAQRRREVRRARGRSAGARVCRRATASDERALDVAQGAARRWRALAAWPRIGCTSRASCTTEISRCTAHVSGRAASHSGLTGIASHATSRCFAANRRLTGATDHAALPSNGHRLTTDAASRSRGGAGGDQRAAGILAAVRGSGGRIRLAPFSSVGGAASVAAGTAVTVRAAGPDRATNYQRHNSELKACPHNEMSGRAARDLLRLAAAQCGSKFGQP